MDDRPPREKAQAERESQAQPGDGGRAWLGMVIVFVCAAITAAVIGWVIWGR